ncbi:hypothetical protein HOLleu_44090 [Holothuria leucospilota]|uniref:CCHC-type domain-containing protein n=1 Tax=Holothuria leucospilota TaxID=206669 RepID=A0A9Q0YDP2_HOLLE|nr:hypothetical protein HOLleu_44090 [Holothuria leucospilota]
MQSLNETYSSTPKVLIAGDSILRDFSKEDFEDNVTVLCLRGGTVSDLQQKLDESDITSGINNVILHIGTNDFANNTPVPEITGQFEALITAIQIKNPTPTKVCISGPCPRLDIHCDTVIELSNSLKELAEKSDCNFIDNVKSFSYGDGEVVKSLFYDDVHLSQSGSDKSKAKFTSIGPVCLRDKRRFNRQRKAYNERAPHLTYGSYRPSYSYQTRRQNPRRYNTYVDWNKQSASDYARGCYKCGERNHNETTCRHPQPLVCNNCRRPGHKSRFCRQQ